MSPLSCTSYLKIFFFVGRDPVALTVKLRNPPGVVE